MLQNHATCTRPVRLLVCRAEAVTAEGARGVGSRLRLARLSVLIGLLVATLLWAGYEIRSRRARRLWQRPLEVAVALVQLGAIDPSALVALRARFPALETRLNEEYHRYGGRLPRPVTFTLFGPVTVDRAPPPDPDTTLLSLA
jgi:hypothetical protein